MYVRLEGWHTSAQRAKGTIPKKAQVGSYDYEQYCIYIDEDTKVKLRMDSDLRKAIHNFNYHNNTHFFNAGVPPKLSNIWVWWPQILRNYPNPSYVLSESDPNTTETLEKMNKGKRISYAEISEFGTF